MDKAMFVASIVGLVSMIRAQFPKVDGVLVAVIAMALGAGLQKLLSLEAAGNLYAQGAVAALAGVGGMTGLGYGAAKLGSALGRASVPPGAK